MMRRIAATPAARGLADDAAVIEVGGEALVLTHDMMVEGVHWLAGQDLADVAWKLVAVNLSDLAAKGAEPLGVLLGFMLGEDDSRFADGLGEALGRYGVPLLGGDTVAGGPPRAFGLTAVGRATCRPVPARSGARPGDRIYVTGTLGAALAEFEALRDGLPSSGTAYRRPVPLLDEGRALAPHVTAMMDVSDGLLIDASRMAEASGATLSIDSAAVPVAVPEERRREALRWGDDYQLLFTLPAGTASPVPAYCIGTVQPAGTHALLIDGSAPATGERLGYTHETARG